MGDILRWIYGGYMAGGRVDKTQFAFCTAQQCAPITSSARFAEFYARRDVIFGSVDWSRAYKKGFIG